MSKPYQIEGSPFWWISYTDPEGVRIRESAKTTSLTEARAILSARQTKVREGKFFDIKEKEKTYLFSELADDFEKSHRLVCESFDDAFKYNLNNLRAAFGGKAINLIEGSDLDNYRITRRKQSIGETKKFVSDSTINRDLSALRRVYNWARTEKKYRSAFEFNPVISQKHLKDEPPAPRGYLDEDAKKQFLESCFVKKAHPIILPRDTFEDICVVLWVTGLRVEELLGLEKGQINFDDSVIHIEKSKGKAERFVPFRKTEVSGILRRHCEGKKNNELVFQWNGQKINYFAIYKVFKKTCQEAGFRGNITIHSLRKTAGTDMAIEGMDILQIQYVLGHKDIDTTFRYVDRNRVMSKKASESVKILSNSKTETYRYAT